MATSAFPTYLRPVLRAMQLHDLDLVMQIEVQSFPTAWPRAAYEREVTHDGIGRYYVVVPDQADASVPALLAYGGMWLLGAEAHITTIATHPDWRRRGLGTWLLLQMMRRARAEGIQEITLEVREHNQPAIALYEKLGFVAVGLRPHYYHDSGEDARIYTLFGLDETAIAARLDNQLAQLTGS